MRNSSQRGAAVVIALLAIFALCLVVAGALVATYITYANMGTQLESGIKAKYRDNENVYANGTQKVMEIAQVPSMYAADLSKLTREAIGGRYGPEGSKALFQFLKEQNPTIDASMYTKIQQVIEAFRNEFKVAQTGLLDQCRSYENARGFVWSGFWLKLAGYPKLEVDKHCTIVSTDKAAQTFETKRDSGIQLVPR